MRETVEKSQLGEMKLFRELPFDCCSRLSGSCGTEGSSYTVRPLRYTHYYSRYFKLVGAKNENNL
jgi:hypothetical protein